MRRGLIVLLALLVVAPGCGGDDQPEASPPLPDLTVPRTDPPPADTVVEPNTTTEPAVTEADPPETQPETVPDSPTNDTPPPTDSPAERFEDFCNENPGSRGCG